MTMIYAVTRAKTTSLSLPGAQRRGIPWIASYLAMTDRSDLAMMDHSDLAMTDRSDLAMPPLFPTQSFTPQFQENSMPLKPMTWMRP